MHVLIVGASGGCGRHLLTDMAARDDVSITVLCRSEASLPQLSDEARKRVKAVVVAGVEAITEAELVEHMNGCDAVLSCLGHHEHGAKGVTYKAAYGPKNQRQLCTDFSKKVCSSARELNPTKPIKYIVIASPGSGGAHGRLSDDDPPRPCGERMMLWLLEKLVPPHRDNVMNAQFLQTQMPGGESMNSHMEICVLRPDDLVNISDAQNKGVVGEYTVHEELQYGLFNAGVTSRENVGRFMADLLTDMQLWEQWKGKFPQVLDSFQPGKR